MRKKKNIDQEINEFLDTFGRKDLESFLISVLPLLELYNVDESSDWVRDAVGVADCRNVRLIRTVYLLSILAEAHANKLYSVRLRFKGLWKRIALEGAKYASEVDSGQTDQEDPEGNGEAAEGREGADAGRQEAR